MVNTCGNCKHWQCANKLRDRTEWSDCYYVVATLQPKLLLCYNQVDETTRTYFKVPFDPHDVKYWGYNVNFMKRYTNYRSRRNKWHSRLVRCCVTKEEDFKYDQHGAERTAMIKLHYFQTNRDYGCELWNAL